MNKNSNAKRMAREETKQPLVFISESIWGTRTATFVCWIRQAK